MCHELSACDVFLARSQGDKVCLSRKGGIGGGGWVYPKGETEWPCLGLALEKPWVPFLSSFAQMVLESVLSPFKASEFCLNSGQVESSKLLVSGCGYNMRTGNMVCLVDQK